MKGYYAGNEYWERYRLFSRFKQKLNEKKLKKIGYIKCSNCKHMTHPGNYCEFCGRKLI